jgi:lipid-A-disaccharide synthase
VVRELIQDDAEPAWIAAEIARILTDNDYAQEMRAKLAGIRAKLGSSGASERAARLAEDLIAQKAQRDT